MRLLFGENISYGFWRNVWALRSWAFGLEVVAFVVVGVVALEAWTGELSSTFRAISVELWASLVLIVLHAFFCAFKIRAEWVRLAAEAYAQQLLAECDALEAEHAA